MIHSWAFIPLKEKWKIRYKFGKYLPTPLLVKYFGLYLFFTVHCFINNIIYLYNSYINNVCLPVVSISPSFSLHFSFVFYNVLGTCSCPYNFLRRLVFKENILTSGLSWGFRWTFEIQSAWSHSYLYNLWTVGCWAIHFHSPCALFPLLKTLYMAGVSTQQFNIHWLLIKTILGTKSISFYFLYYFNVKFVNLF